MVTEKKIFNYFTIYGHGGDATWTVWTQTSIPPFHRGSIRNLTLIGPVVSEEMFEECGWRTPTMDDGGLPILKRCEFQVDLFCSGQGARIKTTSFLATWYKSLKSFRSSKLSKDSLLTQGVKVNHGDKVHHILFRAETLLLSWRARHYIHSYALKTRKRTKGCSRTMHKMLVCIEKFQLGNISRNL